MRLKVTASNLAGSLNELGQQIPFESLRQNEVQISSFIGNGRLTAHTLRDGLELFTANDLKCKEEVNVDFTCRNDKSLLSLTMISSGNPTWKLARIGNHSQINRGAIMGTGITEKELILDPNQNTSFYNVLIKKDFFHTSISGMQDSNQDFLYKAMEQEKNNIIHLPELTAEMKIVLHQISSHSYEGALKNIFLEGKILELMTLFLAQTMNHQTTSKLRKTDIDRIYEAQNILHKDLENPPSVLKLARIVGLNETKLRQGFKFLFNTTVYDYLRKLRMIEARTLLLEKELNVSEAGIAVGYSNISHFARAFRQEFGMNPSEISKYN